MSIEDTTGLFPEGEFTFTIAAPPEKVERGGFLFWEFKFRTNVDGAEANYTESLPMWLCGPMFRVLGFPEIRPGKFDVEPAKALGKSVRGTIVYETLTSGKRMGSVVARMKGMVAVDTPVNQAPLAELGADDIPF